jgi:hypothetical protein
MTRKGSNFVKRFFTWVPCLIPSDPWSNSREWLTDIELNQAEANSRHDDQGRQLRVTCRRGSLGAAAISVGNPVAVGGVVVADGDLVTIITHALAPRETVVRDGARDGGGAEVEGGPQHLAKLLTAAIGVNLQNKHVHTQEFIKQTIKSIWPNIFNK